MGRERVGSTSSADATDAAPKTASLAVRSASGKDVAAVVAPLLTGLFGHPLPVRFEFWDGSALGPSDGPGTVLVRSPTAISRMLWAPGELGIGRAYVAGELRTDGDMSLVLRALHAAAPPDFAPDLRRGARPALLALRAAFQLGVLGRPPSRPAVEAAPHGRRHSKGRDAEVIRHHYNISNEFYRLVLGPSMTYSCARYVEGSTDLAAAQNSKHDLICRKLGLHERPDMRLLDVGCGWGSMALHAASHYGARVVGVTLSSAQADLARLRVKEAQLDEQIEIRVQDYRDLRGERFDAISSIGMFEHVGAAQMTTYFTTLHALLGTGRLLNHAISSVGGSRMARNSFIGRYVFPDGELIDVGQVVLAMQRAGFEMRDVESLREHYTKTLRAWVENLEANWDAAVSEVGVQRARVWHLYMAASANGFDDGGLSLHQVLGVRSRPGGNSGMPATRREWS
jgi:cyclopropane-fatty-acyl-phospholipid synthase